MLRQRFIPSLLLRDARLVKGVRFGAHRDAGRPDTTARTYNAQGADEAILLDIDATREGRGPDTETISRVAAECYMPLTVGGGIRTLDDARACMAAGADKLCVNTGAMDNPDLIETLARRYGSQAIVLGVDVAGSTGEPRVYDHRTARAGARRAVDWVREGAARGAGEIRLMAVDREGTRTGMDLILLSQVADTVTVPVILEGGAGLLEHIDEAFAAGAAGVAAGTLLVFSDNNIVKIKGFLQSQGRAVRRA